MANEITVEIPGAPELYMLPTDRRLGEVLGVVRRGDGARGALVRLPTGRLVQVNAGVVRTLPPLALPGA